MHLSAAFDVSVSEVVKWRMKFPEFARACEVGGELANKAVKRALYNRAVGYDYDAVKIFQYEGVPVVEPFVQHVPPDIGAIKYWLENMDSDNWASKTETKHSGKVSTDGPSLDLSKLDDAELEVMRGILAKSAVPD